MEARRGQVSYSTAARLGPECYDASSAVYYALRAGGLLPIELMGNCDDLRDALINNGWEEVAADDADPTKRGDVFIWGMAGASDGDSGHTGIFTSDANIIHCNQESDEISLDNYASVYANYSDPPVVIYRNANATDSDLTEVMDNTGELDLLAIQDGLIVAQGWQYSPGKDTLYIAFMDAETGQEIGRVLAEPVLREDLKETYPDTEEIENSGFEVSFEVENHTSVYIKGIRVGDDGKTDEIIFSQIITLELAEDVEVNEYASTNEKFFYEVYRNGELLYRDNKILNTLGWSNELMYVPTTDITVSIDYLEHFTGREEVLLYINHKVFHGIVVGIDPDKEKETLTLDLEHVISEWEYRQVSTNLAVKNRTVNDIYSTYDFRYPGWNMDYLQNAAQEVIDYVYSRQNKLDALTKTCELTEDLFWRIGFGFGRTVEIGSFGDEKYYTLSKRPVGRNNIQIISDPEITYDFDSVINAATVYGEKSDSGMSSMSLRDVYEEPGAQIEGFPIRILSNEINNERSYNYLEFSKLAPNNDTEYTVIDEESVAMEGDTLIEATYSFNDIAPFNTDGDEITDEDRKKAALTAYEAAVKKLKLSRRRYIIDVKTTELPADIQVGDKIRFYYDNDKYVLEECSAYQKRILTIDNWFYITAIDYEFDENGVEINTVSMEKELHIDKEGEAE